MMKIKVLHILRESYPLMNGYVIRTENIITRLRDRVSSLDVVGSIFQHNAMCLKDGEKFSKDGITYFQMLSKRLISFMEFIEKLPKVRLIFHYMYIILNTILIMIKTQPKSYDLIHGHSTFSNGLSSLFIAKLFDKKFIYDIHTLSIDHYINEGIRYKFEKKITDWIFKGSDALIVIDPLLKDRIQSKFRVDIKKIFVAPNGVDYNFFKPQKEKKALRKQLSISEDIFLLGVDDSKSVENFDFILKNFSKIKKRIPGVQLLVFNSKRNFSDKDIIIKRQIPFADMPNYYNIVDLFIMPRLSNGQTETITPLKLLEIMSCKVPVLVSNVGGLTDCVTQNHTGFIFEVNNSENLLQQVEYIYKNDTSETCENAREWVIKNKNWEDSVKAYEKAYEYII